MPVAFLRRAGIKAETIDISVEGLDVSKVKHARFVGISVPMHTALRLGLRVAKEIRRLNHDCHICFYGLYASLNADYLLNEVADSVIGGEFEGALCILIEAVQAGASIDIDGVSTRRRASKPVLARLNFGVPDRNALVPLEHYARLDYNSEQRLVGYVEASRGCLHLCTHCPIPPVYNGRFFVVPKEVVLEDVRRLAASGARHITFGDPDFLNGPRHSLQIVRAMHQEFPDLTFDFTAKVAHILKHRELIADFARSGCIFVVTAVESLSDVVLEHLDKGHTRDDVFEALRILRGARIAMRPTFVPFTPWTTLDGYLDLLRVLAAEQLVENVAPIQLGIRLLIPEGSRLLELVELRATLDAFNAESLVYPWQNPDPRVDTLGETVQSIAAEADRNKQSRSAAFTHIWNAAHAAAGLAPPRLHLPAGRAVPFLSEPWYCCAEPTRDQLVSIGSVAAKPQPDHVVMADDFV